MPHPPGHSPYVVGSTKCLHSGQVLGSSSTSSHMPAGACPAGRSEVGADPEFFGSGGSLIWRQGQFGVSHFPGPLPCAIISFSRQQLSSPERLVAYLEPPGPFPREETGGPLLWPSGGLRSPEFGLLVGVKAGLRWVARCSRKTERSDRRPRRWVPGRLPDPSGGFSCTVLNAEFRFDNEKLHKSAISGPNGP